MSVWKCFNCDKPWTEHAHPVETQACMKPISEGYEYLRDELESVRWETKKARRAAMMFLDVERSIDQTLRMVGQL